MPLSSRLAEKYERESLSFCELSVWYFIHKIYVHTPSPIGNRLSSHLLLLLLRLSSEFFHLSFDEFSKFWKRTFKTRREFQRTCIDEIRQTFSGRLEVRREFPCTWHRWGYYIRQIWVRWLCEFEWEVNVIISYVGPETRTGGSREQASKEMDRFFARKCSSGTWRRRRRRRSAISVWQVACWTGM